MATKVEYLMTHIERRLQGIANDMYELQQENARLTAELAAARDGLTKLMQWATPDEGHEYDMTIVLSANDYEYFAALGNGTEIIQ